MNVAFYLIKFSSVQLPNIVSQGKISGIFENVTILLEINTLANKSYVISKLIPLGKHVERS